MRAPSRSWSTFLVFVSLALVAAALRVHPAVLQTTATGIDFLDPDTVRRLVRLQHLDTASEYPAVEPRDGYPAGTVLQWTVPMDVVIRALDAVAPRLHTNAKPYETGAALAGPVLGVLATLLFAWLARRLLSPGLATLAAVLYATSAPAIEVTRLGNGDHQSLQDLCAVGTVLGVLVLATRGGGKVLAGAIGAALGTSLWVNAESMVLLGIGGMTVLVALAGSDRAAVVPRLPALQAFAIATAATTVVGQLVESGGVLTVEWDRISCLQSAASLGLLGFVLGAAAALRRGMRPVVAVPAAAGLAAAVALAPFVVWPPWRDRLGEQLAAANDLTRFATACVAEYRALFADGTALARLVYGDTIFLLPLCLLALPWARSLPGGLRAALLVPTCVLGGLVLHQVKLSHLFAIPLALVLAIGGSAALDAIVRWRAMPAATATRARRLATAALVAASAWHVLSLALTPPSPEVTNGILDRRDVVAAVRGATFASAGPPAAERTAVMAPWDLGHFLLRDTDKPIVASSYQRRIDGIRDSFDVLCSTPDAALAILQRRQVRWWVRNGDPSFLLQYHDVLPERRPLGRVVHEAAGARIALDPTVKDTLWARTAVDASCPEWLESIFTSPRETTWWGSLRGPAFRVYRVRYPDEPR